MAGDASRENGRKGGRPKGRTTRPQLRDQLTQDQVDGLVEKAVERANEGSILLKFMLEQVFGKAPQPLTGADGGPIQNKGVEITVRKK